VEEFIYVHVFRFVIIYFVVCYNRATNILPVNATVSRYIVHSDTDLKNLHSNPRKFGNHNFITSAVRVLRQHDSVVFVNAPACTDFHHKWATNNCDNGGCSHVGRDLTVVARNSRNAPGPYVSTQLFVADTARVKNRLWPLPWWTDMIEVILIKLLGERGFLYGYLNGDKSNVCRPD
jgi:hypothetical protein